MAAIHRRPGVVYSVLTPNLKGFEAALKASRARRARPPARRVRPSAAPAWAAAHARLTAGQTRARAVVGCSRVLRRRAGGRAGGGHLCRRQRGLQPQEHQLRRAGEPAALRRRGAGRQAGGPAPQRVRPPARPPLLFFRWRRIPGPIHVTSACCSLSATGCLAWLRARLRRGPALRASRHQRAPPVRAPPPTPSPRPPVTLRSLARLHRYVSTAVHCPYSGAVDPRAAADVAVALDQMGCREGSMSDTTGAGTPASVARMYEVRRVCVWRVGQQSPIGRRQRASRARSSSPTPPPRRDLSGTRRQRRWFVWWWRKGGCSGAPSPQGRCLHLFNAKMCASRPAPSGRSCAGDAQALAGVAPGGAHARHVRAGRGQHPGGAAAGRGHGGQQRGGPGRLPLLAGRLGQRGH